MSALLTTLALQITLAQTPKDDFASLYTNIASAIKTRYYARTSRKAEMDSALARFETPAKAAKTRAEFTAAMDGMIEAFGDSHFAFLPDHRQGYYTFDALARQENARKLPNIGAWFDEKNNEFTVKMLLNNGPADRAGLRVGDQILRIADQPFTPVESLRPNLGKSTKLTFRRNGKDYETQVTPDEHSSIEMFFLATRNSATIVEVDGKKVAYLRVWTMGDRKFRDFFEFFLLRGNGQNSDAMVYDLRSGFGGRPEGYYEPFFAPQFTVDWNVNNTTVKQITGYQKPVIVLTNQGTRSAKEVVSYIFKKSQRATLMGSPTAGDVLGTTPYKVADWAYLEIPMVDLSIEGQRLEKNPVKPDIELGQEFSPEGEDLYLPAALKQAANLAAQNTPVSAR